MVIKECTGEKLPQKILRIPRGSLGQACQERNSLGRTLTPCKGKKSLRILDQTNVVLSLDERDVLELDEKLAELLFPITNCEERYALLCNKSRLERVRDIDCGSKVRVQLRSGDEPLPGVVRFKGSLLPDRALSGIWFGVELLVRTFYFVLFFGEEHRTNRGNPDQWIDSVIQYHQCNVILRCLLIDC